MLKKQLNDSYSLLPNSNKWNFLWVPIFFPLVAQLKLFSVIFLNLENTLKVNQDLSALEKNYTKLNYYTEFHWEIPYLSHYAIRFSRERCKKKL